MVKQGQIYIRGYPKDLKEDELRQAFKDFGDIVELKMVTASYSFVTYDKAEQAQVAIEKMNGQMLQGSALVVEKAGEKRNSTGPKPDDICRNCNKKGHWRNSCPERRQRYRSRRRRSYSSSESERRHRKRKDRRRRRRSSSSESSSRSDSSESRDRRRKSHKKRDRRSRHSSESRSVHSQASRKQGKVREK